MKFISKRAAQIAMTKAEKAYKSAISAFYDSRGLDTYLSTYDKLQADIETARLHGVEVYDSARAQGFYVQSYHFGYNATRELISDNVD
ncbi:MAG: hypothetical protein E6Q97_11330 [Desulfurellales bacterium]|nr:MAG: hypothetical protein E6Q97_11330 [Desulfurellales bacterium]